MNPPALVAGFFLRILFYRGPGATLPRPTFHAVGPRATLMNVVWLYLVLQGGDAIFIGRKVTPVTVCIYREYHNPDTETRYTFYIHVNATCPPYVRHTIREIE